jgi:hypothetical protein
MSITKPRDGYLGSGMLGVRDCVAGVVSRVSLLLGVLLVVFGVVAASGSAESLSPWFHLSSVARPGFLSSHPGLSVGRDEVQEVVSTPGSVFFLAVGGAPAGAFEGEPYPGPFGGAVPIASAANLQVALEGAYGAGNVLVEGGPAGVAPLTVRSVGGDAHSVVAPLEVSNLEGSTTATVVTAAEAPGVDGYLAATAVNVGETAADGGSGSPVRVVDTLPEGLHAVTAEGNTENSLENAGPVSCSVKSARMVECVFSGKLSPSEELEAVVGVVVQPGARSGEQNAVDVTGGGAPAAHLDHAIVVSSGPTPFGVEEYALTPEEVGGKVDRQAGSHPFQLTTTFNVRQVPDPHAFLAGEAEPAGLAKNLNVRLPAGLIGNPTAVPQCTLAQFNNKRSESQDNQCPESSVVGVATVTFLETEKMLHATLPLYNLTPTAGEPARFGFQPATVPVLLDTSVRTGEDYGVNVTVENIPQTIGFLSNTVTFWGVPGDPRHDSIRGLDCLAEAAETPHGPCQPLGESHPPPLLSMPTSCSGRPLETSASLSSWAEPHNPVTVSPEPGELMPTLGGCGLLPFAPEIQVAPDVHAASTPSGLSVDVHVRQEGAVNGEGLSPADVKNITVALPEGLQLNPSAADGLEACSLAQIGFKGENPETHTQEFTPAEPSCPDASKIASVTLKLPILPQGQNVTGFVYLAAPQNFSPLKGALKENPFGSLVAMYVVAKDPVSGILVKLPGRVVLSATGQITAVFENSPQAPFEDAEIEFFGGERAPLATPARCNSYPTTAVFEPWTNGGAIHEAITSSSSFDITSGANGTPCPGTSLAFSPTLASESSDVNAGTFTPLVTTLSREDGQQPIQSVTLHYPPGLSGILKGIPLCPEAAANTGTCPASSEIGETIVSVGVGADPFTVTGGKVYLTEKYAGAPFGLSIVNPAKAGPFNLQEGRPVVVRAKIDIDPSTAALTITTGAIPTIIEGFALQIKHVNVTITRPKFTFNPTNCNPMSITGTIKSSEGASAPVSVPFQVANCSLLKFAPKFTASTSAHTSRADGASLTVKVTYPNAAFGTQANIAKVKVELPKALPSRLTTLQKACTAAQFKANPTGCPKASVVGHATAITPLLPVPLQGKAYFVSNGGEAFPNLILVLEGYGVRIDLVGDTLIKHGITSSTFKTVPDAPVTSFQLTLPEGRYSALGAPQPLCNKTLLMPTQFTAQNGQTKNQTTHITTTGCKKHHTKHHKHHKHT